MGRIIATSYILNLLLLCNYIILSKGIRLTKLGNQSPITKLLSITNDVQQGINTKRNAEIIDIINSLKVPSPSTFKQIEGKWQLLWTTEKVE